MFLERGKLIMSEKFGSLKYLSSQTAKRIELLIQYIDELDISYDIYYGYPIIDESDHKEYVKGFIITCYGILILYEHEEEKNTFASCFLNHITNDSSLMMISMNFDKYIKFINLSIISEHINENLFIKVLFSDEEILKINRAIQKSYNLTKDDQREILHQNSLGAQIKKRNTFIGKYDSTQFNMVHTPIESHQRIRGLAGSGKTILMLKKLAFLHYNNPNLNLAFVFYTISLKSSLIKQFESFYRDYDRYGEPDMSKVNILHAWGGNTKGFYSDLCDRNNFKRRTFNEAKDLSENLIDPFEYICKELNEYLKSTEFDGLYDYVFVDEAQDFGINFFHLCLSSLKTKTDGVLNTKKSGFLIYAYDELQSLKEEASIPSKIEIFGNEEKCKDINLKISYRTTVEVLTTAHAIGLGIYRDVENEENPLVNYVEESNFLDMGYKNKYGNFSKGSLVCLYRDEEKSDIIIPDPLEFKNEKEQYEYLSDMIINFVNNEDVLPSDIMIIDLDERYLQKNHKNFSNIFYEKLSHNQCENNIRIRLMDKNTPNRTTIENELIFTSIYRAKGNEANLVIIINCNSVPLSSRNSLNRNKIFTAMTRSKWLVWLLGQNMDDFKSEIQKVRNNNYMLEYKSPTDEELKKIKLLSAEEEKMDTTTTNIEKMLDNLPEDVIKKLLAKHINKE